MTVARHSGRTPEQLRTVTLETGVNRYAEGSCLVTFGHTKVLVTASLEDSVTGWMRGKGQGWVTADVSPWVDWIWKGGWPWLLLKVGFFASAFIWFRATFPRYRYDQIMRLGWKIFIPVTLVWLLIVGFWMHSPWNIWH